MRSFRAPLLCLLVALPSFAANPLCEDGFSSCREDCSIEFGTSIKGRERVGKCIQRCAAERSKCETRAAKAPDRQSAPGDDTDYAKREFAPSVRRDERDDTTREVAPPRVRRDEPERPGIPEPIPERWSNAVSSERPDDRRESLPRIAPPGVGDLQLEGPAPRPPNARGTSSNRISGIDVRPATTNVKVASPGSDDGDREDGRRSRRRRGSSLVDEAQTPTDDSQSASTSRRRRGRGMDREELDEKVEHSVPQPNADERNVAPPEPANTSGAPDDADLDPDAAFDEDPAERWLPTQKEPLPPDPWEHRPASGPKEDISDWDPDGE